MIKKLASVILVIATAIATMAIYLNMEGDFLRWVLIFFLMLFAMLLCALILGEHPYEFFENFGNYKDAKVSAIFMVVAFIAVIMAIKEFLGIAVNK